VSFVLVNINYTKGFHCDISVIAYRMQFMFLLRFESACKHFKNERICHALGKDTSKSDIDKFVLLL
jgi:hypothetical protein